MDDLDKYLSEQMKDSVFRREWENSLPEFESEELEIKNSLKRENNDKSNEYYLHSLNFSAVR